MAAPINSSFLQKAIVMMSTLCPIISVIRLDVLKELAKSESYNPCRGDGFGRRALHHDESCFLYNGIPYPVSYFLG